MWMKVDDQLHAHRKMRTLSRSHATKRRDIAPMGLWVAAGSWSAQNATDGWVPEDELDRWDEDWRTLVNRLVAAGWWWPSDRDGESGYSFNDWHDFNPESGLASRSGAFGNHVRWHANKGIVNDECEHCPTDPDGDIGGRSGGDDADIVLAQSSEQAATGPSDITAGQSVSIGAISGGESGQASRSIALPVPDPTRSRPDPVHPSSDKSDQTKPPDRFEEFWETYAHKLGRKKAETAYRAALKKPGVTADLLIASAAAYITWQIGEGKHPTFTKHAATWLHGEHWRDERPARAAPRSRVQEHLALVQQLQDQPTPQIGSS